MQQLSSSKLRFWLITFGCLVLVLGLVAITVFSVVRARQPYLPVEWQRLNAGMSRAQIEAAISDPFNYLREEKGFDSTHRQITPQYVWTLLLYYDTQGQTISGEIRLIHLRHGFMGRSAEELF